MLMAGEYSGTVYGAAVARQIREHIPQVRISGVGSPEMAEAGVELLFDSSNWGGIGPVEALKRSYLYLVYLRLKRIIASDPPDLILLVDYPGFNMLVARYAKSLGIPTLYFFPPGKFCQKAEQITDAARTVTRFAAPFRATYDRYSEAKANVSFVGHPMLDLLPTIDDPTGIRKELSVPEMARPLIGILPGSRHQEVRMHSPLLCECARQLAEDYPDVHFIVPIANVNAEEYRSLVEADVERFLRSQGISVNVVVGRAYEVMAVSDLLLVTSGTATLEAAYYRVPMVITYKTTSLTKFLSRVLLRKYPRFFGLPNLLAERQIVPEFIQDAFVPKRVSDAAKDLLDNSERAAQVRKDLDEVVRKLGARGATDRVARMAVEMLA